MNIFSSLKTERTTISTKLDEQIRTVAKQLEQGEIDEPINDGIALLNVRYYTAARNLLDNLSTIQDD